METKVYSLFGKNGVMEEIKPVGELPIGTKIYAFGAGMSESVYCISGPKDSIGSQEMCLVSNYYEGAYFSAPRTRFDKYSRPLSAKFGIGFYWDDVENYVYPESTVKAAIRRANYLEKKIAEKQKAKAEAERKERAELPSRFPWLTPIDRKLDTYKQLRANIVADLKHHFPDVKFSIKKQSYSSIYIYWTDGPTRQEVCKITGQYEDHVTDFTGDFRDYEPSIFNEVFGGINYVFEEREISESINELYKELMELMNFGSENDARSSLYDIVCKTSFPAGACNFGIDRSNITCGSIHEVFKITFDVPEKKEAKPVPEKLECNGVEVIDYSEKSFAVYGNTKPIKDELKQLGGRFNMYLKASAGFTFAGWIFPMSKKQQVLATLGI